MVADLVTDANAARPVTAGGTGETTARLKDGTWRFQNTADTTKLLAFDLTGLATATTRTVTMPDANVTLGTITPWVEYTPTFTSFGTVTGISMWSRRVGDSLHVRGYFTTGTCVGNQARMGIGFNGTDGNVTASAAKVEAIQGAGTVTQGAVSGTTIIPLINGTLAYVLFGGQSTGRDGLTAVNANSVFADATRYAVTAEIPITGW